jgi:small subunit ribosomal protein S6
MPLYEHVLMARQDISAQQAEALVEQFKSIITTNGGKVVKTETWGLKTLAYRIRKNRKAHYALMATDTPAPAVAEMERQLRLNEDILRFMTVKVEAHEDGPSAMMQKRDRDERRGERRRDRDDRRGGGGGRRGEEFGGFDGEDND